MGESDISKFGGFTPQDPNAAPIGQTDNIQGAQGQQDVTDYTASTLKKSEIDTLILLLAAGFPILTPPGLAATNWRDFLGNDQGVQGVGGGALTSVAMLWEKTKNDIISKMWTTYQDTLEEIAREAKEKDIKRWTEDVDKNGPQSAVEYLAYLMSLSASQLDNELNTSSSDNVNNALTVQFNNAFNEWLAAPVQQDSNASTVTGVRKSLGDYPDSSFIAGCVACNVDVLRQAIGASSEALGFQLSVSPIADALFAIGPHSGLPVDSQAAAALIAALLNNGAVYKATSDTIEESVKTAQPPRDINFALNYAKSIVAIVTSKTGEGSAANENRLAQNKMVKLMLSTMALNLVYRSAYGGMSGKELADLVKGNTGEIPEKIKPTIDQLLELIDQYLPVDSEARTNTIVSLMEYVDSKKSVDSMLQTTKMFKSFLTEATDIESQRIIQTNGN